MGIFDKRISYKPLNIQKYYNLLMLLINLFWVHSEIDFTADVQDFHSNLQPYEQNAVKHALLAIAQIEVSVKLSGKSVQPCQNQNSMVWATFLQNANSVTVRLILDYWKY